MNRLFYISLLLLSLASCTASKKSISTESTVKTDSFRQVVSLKDTNASNVTRTRTEKDSAIGIAARSVSDSIAKDDQEVVSARTGRKKSVYKETRQNGLTAWVAIDTNGNIRFGANSDSFTLIVKGLIRERDSFSALYRQQQLINRVAGHTTTIDRVSETVKTKRTVWGWILDNSSWLLPIVVLVVFLARYFLKSFPALWIRKE